MMVSRVAVWGMVLLCLILAEDAAAGTSFLSPSSLPKQDKHPTKKVSPGKLYRRGAGELWDSLMDQLVEEEREFMFKIPLDISVRMTEEQFEQQESAVQETLMRFLSQGPAQDKMEGTE
ncbi:appetite-regulating hormone isoform 2-T2 [Discoglossus pictus]